MMVVIQRQVGSTTPTFLCAILRRGIVRLIGYPEWVTRCAQIRGHTPEDGALYLRALQEEYPFDASSAYGAPFAVAITPS